MQGQAFSEVFYEIGDNPLFQFDSILGRNSLVVPARDVLHVKLATPRHPLVGETWLAALAIETAANRRHAIPRRRTFAGNMSRPSGVITTDHAADEGAGQGTARQVERAGQQDINAGGVPILTPTAEIPAADDLERRIPRSSIKGRLNDRQVAAVFGVPAILLGITDTGTQKSAEAVMAEWLASGLGLADQPYRARRSISFVGLNADSVGRARVDRIRYRGAVALGVQGTDRGLARGVQAGIYAPNEARYKLGFAAVAGGFGKMPRVSNSKWCRLDCDAARTGAATAGTAATGRRRGKAGRTR